MAVDQVRRRIGLAALKLVRCYDRMVIGCRPKATVAPVIEIALHRRIGRSALGLHSPLAPRRRHVQEGVNGVARIRRARTAYLTRRRPKEHENGPNSVRYQIARAGSIALVLLTFWIIVGLVRPSLISCTAAEPLRRLGIHQQQFDVLTFNALLRPFLPEGQNRRAPLIPGQLEGYDVVLMQEVFSNFHRDIVLRGLRIEYPYQSNVLGQDRGFYQDGGVVIASRWPIEAETQLLFGDLCRGKDCFADKGALYARINKAGFRVHVIATHLQSGENEDVTRERQISKIKQWIDTMELPLTEPLLIGGDLNVDRLANESTGAFTKAMENLNSVHPVMPLGIQNQVTFSPTENALADGARAQYLDYVLYSKAHLKPVETFNMVRRIYADGEPLSDHYAVHGRFHFEYILKLDVQQ